MQLKVKRLTETARMPVYATGGSACFDLMADGCVEPFELRQGERREFGTGLAFEVPPGHAMLIFSRSGHGFKHGVRLVNCVGVIDSDYRGEVKVSLHCDLGVWNRLCVHPGDRIAQAMLVRAPAVELVEVDELSQTERGVGGFGSTGA